MSCRLVPKSVTLNNLVRHNGHHLALFGIILLYSVAFVANYVKVVDKPSTDFLPRNVIKYVHQLSTTDALCSLR